MATQSLRRKKGYIAIQYGLCLTRLQSIKSNCPLNLGLDRNLLTYSILLANLGGFDPITVNKNTGKKASAPPNPAPALAATPTTSSTKVFTLTRHKSLSLGALYRSIFKSSPWAMARREASGTTPCVPAKVSSCTKPKAVARRE